MNEESQLQVALQALYTMRELKQRIMNEESEAISNVLTDEQRQAIELIKAKSATEAEEADALIQKTESQIKEAVRQMGRSIKSEKLQAVFSEGRISWDSKGLQGYAAAVPDLWQFAKQGEPSVTIREVK